MTTRSGTVRWLNRKRAPYRNPGKDPHQDFLDQVRRDTVEFNKLLASDHRVEISQLKFFNKASHSLLPVKDC
ncbi:hypothetical protein EJ110_NYTH23661 [Nymphaea thermarum]|nr:hypothetical protein EJ110_NYTH23661 [Nymphaea thermarum]